MLENTERAKLVAKKTKIKYFYIEHENPKAAEQVPLSFAYLKSLREENGSKLLNLNPQRTHLGDFFTLSFQFTFSDI